MRDSLRRHWPEYLMEGAELALFMISASVFALLLFHSQSPVLSLIERPVLRRGLMGIAMGATAAALVYSPWGKQSGAHMNPAVTLTFLRLGKVARADALFYILFQMLGGVFGVLVVVTVANHLLADPGVNYVVTVPGPVGAGAAFAAEFSISFVLMMAVLWLSNSRLARWTGLLAGMLVAINILLAAPISGMSMNPARTFATAIPSHVWQGIWIYFTAPPMGMLLAAESYRHVRGRAKLFCAKLHHQNETRCIFCEYHISRDSHSTQ